MININQLIVVSIVGALLLLLGLIVLTLDPNISPTLNPLDRFFVASFQDVRPGLSANFVYVLRDRKTGAEYLYVDGCIIQLKVHKDTVYGCEGGKSPKGH